MRLPRELLIIALGQTLVLLLAGGWLGTVYEQEVDKLKAETNVLFFESIEEAENKLFISNFSGNHSAQIKADLVLSNEDRIDSIHTRQIFVFEAQSENADSIRREMMHNWFQEREEVQDSQVNVRVAFRRDAMAEILIQADSLVHIDFDTTEKYLRGIYLSKVANSPIAGLRTDVIRNPFDTSFQSSFVSKPGKLGNILFGTTEYVASVDSFLPLVIKRMVPEILIALIFFTVILFAFISMYQNLRKERRLSAIKDDFISNMSHELKTPISVVSVALEALKDFNVLTTPDKAQQYIQVSKVELARLSNMVEKILSTATSADMHGEENKSVVDFGEIVDGCCASMQVECDRAGKSMSYVREGNDFRVLGDTVRLRSVVYNLLDNAIKYTGEEGRIEVRLVRDSESLELLVKDDGPGIPTSYLDQIFTKFFRVPAKNIHDVKGYGLGLYNLKNIVESLHGRVDVKSSNEGTEFQVRIPTVND